MKAFKKNMDRFMRKHMKHVVQAVTAFCVLVAITTTAIVAGSARKKDASAQQSGEVVVVNATASAVDKQPQEESRQTAVKEESDSEEADPASQEAVIRIAGMTETEMSTEQETTTLSAEQMAWQGRMVPKVEDYLAVRAEADQNSEMIGKLHRGDAADVLETQGGWIKIRSGDVEGFVREDFALLGDAAFEHASGIVTVYAKNITDGLRVRAEADVNAPILVILENGKSLVMDKEAAKVEGWIAVKYEEKTGYVSDEFVELHLDVGTGITIKAERESIEAERLAKEKAERESREAAERAAIEASKEAQRLAEEESRKAEAKKKKTVSGGAISASASDLDMLAAIIECEAGSESYESKLAVGAVVVNRVQSSQFPNSISEVIYQSGQFTPVAAGGFAKVLARGADESCYQAARDALGGADNTGGCLYFRTANGRPGLIIERMVFY